jgi:asparagine synthase (glutamine-hydrolysing)
MCGICGILNFDGEPVNKQLVGKMTASIAHRGPDNEGLFVKGPVGLGHRRLAIIDCSESGNQPMSNEDKTIWITYNGEIYNFKNLRKELESCGHRFQSNTDTEVIIHSYEEWGTDCLKRFNGMFAFAIWDENKDRLWLVRDRMGVKPLFYCNIPSRLLFGSEIKAIIADSRVDRQVDYEALSYFLALNYTPAPFTLFSRVKQVMPGHYLMISMDGCIEDVEYWRLSFNEDKRQSEKQYLETFANLLEDAVKIRLVSDVPFGVFLSGGLDSSSIAYWMSRNMDVVKTFSIGFEQGSYSEIGYARKISSAIKSDHYDMLVNMETPEVLSKIVWHSEEPTADSSMAAVFYLARLAKTQVSMVLGGDGADELLAGYETYSAYYVRQAYRLIPSLIRKTLIANLIKKLPVSHSKVSFDFKARRFVKGAELSAEDAHASWRTIFDADARKLLLEPISQKPGVAMDAVDLFRKAFQESGTTHPLNRMLYVDTRLYMPNDMLVKVDRMTMAHSLEAREPYLDHRLVEFAASLPPNLKLKHFNKKKYILKTAMKGKIPQDIIDRKKEGFNVPNAFWINEQLKPFIIDNLSSTRLKDMGLFDNRYVKNTLEDHFNRKTDNSHQIWCLLVLSLWWAHFKPSIRA